MSTSFYTMMYKMTSSLYFLKVTVIEEYRKMRSSGKPFWYSSTYLKLSIWNCIIKNNVNTPTSILIQLNLMFLRKLTHISYNVHLKA